jgi:hypothetical protein
VPFISGRMSSRRTRSGEKALSASRASAPGRDGNNLLAIVPKDPIEDCYQRGGLVDDEDSGRLLHHIETRFSNPARDGRAASYYAGLTYDARRRRAHNGGIVSLKAWTCNQLRFADASRSGLVSTSGFSRQAMDRGTAKLHPGSGKVRAKLKVTPWSVACFMSRCCSAVSDARSG